MRAIELFAGAGGLGIGVSRAGFRPEIIVERDRWCCETLRKNNAFGWPEPLERDIREIDFRSTGKPATIVTGGPPCQPFSLGGKHAAHADRRDMWPEAVRVVREARPKAFIFENVRGLTRQTFATYLSYILLQLQHPSVAKHLDEKWTDHLARLEGHHTGGGEIEYRVLHHVLDAADFGVAQRRHRVVFVGFRSDVKAGWSFPQRRTLKRRSHGLRGPAASIGIAIVSRASSNILHYPSHHMLRLSFLGPRYGMLSSVCPIQGRKLAKSG